MVIVPNKFTFVATPRTGSRSIVEALLDRYPDAISEYPKNHHTDVSLVPRDLPVWTIIRHPVRQLFSWWHHVDIRSKSGRSFEDFVKEYENLAFLPRDSKYRLNIYGEIADRFFVFGYGLDTAAKEMGIVESLPKVGLSRYAAPYPEGDIINTIESEFASDMELYRSCL